METSPLKESELYAPVCSYLQSQGYEVQGEVKNCDIAALKDNELIIIELKKRFNATLLIQAVDRQRFADAVYIGLPHPQNIGKTTNWRGMCNLLKRLEIGLILVHFLTSGPRIEIAFHPKQYQTKRKHKKRQTIIREISSRSGNYNVGGQNRTKLVTAYRENAIHIACCLRRHGPLSPSQLKRLGTGGRTQTVLSHNYYGWFQRVERGVYQLHDAGQKALAEYPKIANYFENNLDSRGSVSSSLDKIHQ